jgi:predicted SAM-dependent methyltransferase
MKFQRVDATPHGFPLGAELFANLSIQGLHCGSGANLKVGFLNTDSMVLVDEAGGQTAPGGVFWIDNQFLYLQHDATKPFPIAGGVFRWIYSEHFIEHIPQPLALAWLKEMRRLLRPGGLVRVSTPDLEKYVRGYLDPEQEFFTEHASRLRQMGVGNVPVRGAWMVNQIFRHWGHQHIYDFEEVKFLAALAGFPAEKALRCGFRSGTVRELAELDRDVRNDESLYVELQAP